MKVLWSSSSSGWYWSVSAFTLSPVSRGVASKNFWRRAANQFLLSSSVGRTVNLIDTRCEQVKRSCWNFLLSAMTHRSYPYCAPSCEARFGKECLRYQSFCAVSDPRVLSCLQSFAQQLLFLGSLTSALLEHGIKREATINRVTMPLDFRSGNHFFECGSA